MRPIATLSILCALAAPAAAQSPRPSIDLSGAVAFAPRTASAGDVSVALYAQPGELNIHFSDGKGLSWGPAVRVDGDISGGSKFIEDWSLQFAGGNLYVAWRDTRNGDQIFMNRVVNAVGGNQTFDGEQVIDMGTTPGDGSAIRAWRMAVAGAGSGNVNVHFAINVDPTSSSLDEELYVTSSQDGGVSFTTPLFVPEWNPQDFDVDNIDLCASNNVAYVAWDDDSLASNPQGDTLWLRKTNNGGLTWDAFLDSFHDSLTVRADGSASTPDTQDWISVDCSAAGNNVALMWMEELNGSGDDALVLRTSTTGWDIPSPRATPDEAGADTDRGTVRITRSRNGFFEAVAVFESDAGGSPDDIFASTYDGSSWLTPVQLSGPSGGDFPAVVQAGRTLAAAWNEGASTDDFGAAYTRNSGFDWNNAGQAVNIADTTGDVDFAALSYNARNSNFIAVWESNDTGDDHAYVGGFRAPTVEAAGFVSGGVAGFNLTGFSGTRSLGLVLVDDSAFTPFCNGDVINMLLTGPFQLGTNVGDLFILAAPLDGNGAGDTTTINLTVPPGTTFHYQALTVSLLGGGNVRVVEATDAGSVVVP